MSDKLKYTTEDIRLYLEGKMTPAQMHALEKAALSDPFLADALEGMEMHGNTERFKADVEDLRLKLIGRSKSKKGALTSVDSLWWKIAAVLVIVVTGVAVIILTAEKHNTAQNEIAKTENELYSRDTLTKSEEKAAPQRKTPEKKIEDVDKIEIDKKAGVVKENSGLVKENNKKNDPEIENQQSSPPAAKVNDLENAGKVPEPEAMRRSDSSNLAEEKIAAAESQKQVKAVQRLEGRAAGVNVTRSEEIDDSVFDEVIVVGYGNAKKSGNKSRTLSAGRAEKRVIPGNGWDEFERYIEDSTRINNADSAFSGEEHLAFTIGDDGLPESIKILRSISPSHDKEAIRLLKNGPSWKVIKGRKREIKLKIIF